jgi:hypothetical protein
MEPSTSEGAKGADDCAFAVAARSDTAYEGCSCETLQARLQCLQVRPAQQTPINHSRSRLALLVILLFARRSQLALKSHQATAV